jgi:hypothetical protein
MPKFDKSLYRRKRKSKIEPENGYIGNEAQLQSQMDDMLAALGIWDIRIPDAFFRWVKMNAPAHIQAAFFRIFGGIPDNLPMVKVSDKYLLCCPVEHKTSRGALHGKQKHWEGKGIPFQISRSPESSIAFIRQLQADAAIVRCLFESQALNAENNKTEK